MSKIAELRSNIPLNEVNDAITLLIYCQTLIFSLNFIAT